MQKKGKIVKKSKLLETRALKGTKKSCSDEGNPTKKLLSDQ